MNTRSVILILIGILLVIGSYFGAKNIIAAKNNAKPKVAKVVKTVFVDTVQNGKVQITIPANGTLLAKNRLELYAENQGLFKSSRRDFKAGQHYRKGEVLLRLDASEFYASIQASRSEFKNLVASIMPDIRLDYPEVFPVWEVYLNSIDVSKSLPSIPEMTSDKVRFFVTGRGLQASYYTIKNLEERLAKYNIVAPYSGVLTEALVTKGTLIRPGQKLGEFIDTSVFEVELAIAKEYSDLLKIGEVVVLNEIDTNNEFTGTVSRINGRIDQATQTIKVFVALKGEGLKEGMYLEALIKAQEEENAIQVSRKLLVDESKLFVVRDSVLDLISVDPVYFSEKEVVLKGIPNGTTIMSQTIPGAYTGMLVTLASNTKANKKSVQNSNK